MQVINYEDYRGRMGIFKNVDEDNIQEVLLCSNKKNTLKGFHCTHYAKTIYLLEGEIEDRYFDRHTLEMKSFHLKAGDHLTVPAYAYHGYFCKTDIVLLYLLHGKFDSNRERTLYPMYSLKLMDGKYNGWTPEDYQMNLESNGEIDIENNTYIISEKDLRSPRKMDVDYLLVGHRGFLGSYVYEELKQQNKNFVVYPHRIEDFELFKNYVDYCEPKYIIYAAGVAGKPNIDWCLENPEETTYQNVTLVMNVVDYCDKNNIKVCVFGSGFIYDDPDRLMHEYDPPNYLDHIYCRLRVYLEQLISVYKNVLYLRIVYPILDGQNEKCFLRKILKYAGTSGVHDVPVCCTVMNDLLPQLFDLIEKRKTYGIMNFVNRGVIRLPEIANIYNRVVVSLENKIDGKVQSKENNYKRPISLLDTTLLEKYIRVDDLENQLSYLCSKLFE